MNSVSQVQGEGEGEELSLPACLPHCHLLSLIFDFKSILIVDSQHPAPRLTAHGWRLQIAQQI